MKFHKKTLAIACFAACTTGSAMAEDTFKNIETSVQYSYGFNDKQDKNLGYGSDGNNIQTVRLQHENDWKYGSSMILLDNLWSDKPLGGGTANPAANWNYGDGYGLHKHEYFGVAGVEVLSSKVFGSEAGTGFIKDYGLSGRYENGSYYNFRAYEIGPQIHLNVPGFDRFKITWWQRWKSDDSGKCLTATCQYENGHGKDLTAKGVDYARHSLIGVDWRTSWNMWGKKWTSQAFIRYQVGQNGGKPEGVGDNVSGVGNRLWVEPDVFVYLTDHVALGLRAYYQYDQNSVKVSNDGYYTKQDKSYFTPNIVLKYDF